MSGKKPASLFDRLAQGIVQIGETIDSLPPVEAKRQVMELLDRAVQGIVRIRDLYALVRAQAEDEPEDEPEGQQSEREIAARQQAQIRLGAVFNLARRLHLPLACATCGPPDPERWAEETIEYIMVRLAQGADAEQIREECRGILRDAELIGEVLRPLLPPVQARKGDA